MRAVLQRVSRARVTVGDDIVGAIERGLLVLLGVAPTDTEAEARWLADKVIGLRIFADAEGKMNLSVAEAGGAVLVVSQFTLYGDCRKGRRPSFTEAMAPGPAEALYNQFLALAKQAGLSISAGRFGAMMEVELCNDGPVTLWLDSRAPR